MTVKMEPIGTAHTDVEKVPRHWSISDVEGRLIIDEKYRQGLKDILPGQKIVVLFHFHQSQNFSSKFLIQKPAHRNRAMGVFSICSPIRPNPIGLSVLEVLAVNENIIHVKRVDMIDGTPILDIKPHIRNKERCPSYTQE
ncbi:tRNA (N6-threonylcarbamoyladenosine(37)-N6)-methyltransferase TrmO [Desulfobacteraceae bacterium SEEP-SAG9]|nr:tRNA (N6-threonylcarbamoyladenosine(37)-N6)-methyltransferase TrmO [Desulfobacteraceae bacterium SEEP-SAG9]